MSPHAISASPRSWLARWEYDQQVDIRVGLRVSPRGGAIKQYAPEAIPIKVAQLQHDFMSNLLFG